MLSFGRRLADFARAHAGCSAHRDVQKYLEAVAPPVDRVPGRGENYFLAAPSTCALFGMRCLASALDTSPSGIPAATTDPELDADYLTEITKAISIVQKVGMRRDAYETFGGAGELLCPSEPFQEGDIVIINGPPYGVHVIVVTGAQANLSGDCPTVEGGQGDGGVQAFVRSWGVRAGGQLYAGASQRWVIGVLRAAKMGARVDGEAVGENVTVNAGDDVEVAAVNEGDPTP